MSRDIMSEKAPEPVGPYPHARRAGDFLYLSGIGPRARGQQAIPGVQLDPTTGQLVSYDFEAQCHAVFQNVAWVLEESGAAVDDLVDVTVFLTSIANDFKTLNKIYAHYFGKARPCRTTVEVNCLPTPIAIELKCIAYMRKA